MSGGAAAQEPCVLRRGDRIDARDPRLDTCKFEDGAIIVFSYGEESDRSPRRKKPMPTDAIKPPVAPTADTSATPSVFTAAPPLAAAPAATTSSVAVPTSASDELSKILPANGQLSGLTVILAAIAVLGGGAAWKFYSQHSKEKHEQKMKELELNAGHSDEQHPSCKAESVAVQAELKKLGESVEATSTGLADVTKRVSSLETKVSAPDLGDNLSELENRVKKIEKSLPKGAKRGSGR